MRRRDRIHRRGIANLGATNHYAAQRDKLPGCPDQRSSKHGNKWNPGLENLNRRHFLACSPCAWSYFHCGPTLSFCMITSATPASRIVIWRLFHCREDHAAKLRLRLWTCGSDTAVSLPLTVAAPPSASARATLLWEKAGSGHDSC